MKLDAINLKQEEQAKIDAEVLKLERDVSQLEIELEAARSAYRKLSRAAGMTATAEKKQTLEFEILRQEAGAAKTLKADRFTMLKPGDMVVVSLQ
jgi:hypothetical protein